MQRLSHDTQRQGALPLTSPVWETGVPWSPKSLTVDLKQTNQYMQNPLVEYLQDFNFRFDNFDSVVCTCIRTHMGSVCYKKTVIMEKTKNFMTRFFMDGLQLPQG